MSLAGNDLHDEIIAEFYLDVRPCLTVNEGTCCMPFIDHEQLENAIDVSYLYANLRFCDAICRHFVTLALTPSTRSLIVTSKRNLSGGTTLPRLPKSTVSFSVVITRNPMSVCSSIRVPTTCGALYQITCRPHRQLDGDIHCSTSRHRKIGDCFWDSFVLVNGPDDDANPAGLVYALFIERRLARMLSTMGWDQYHVVSETSESSADVENSDALGDFESCGRVDYSR
jgi:hypothetical protein